MSEPILASNCCPASSLPITTKVPGPAGVNGATGTNGANGENAWSTTVAIFLMPAVNSSVSVTLDHAGWIAIGQKLFISNAGFFIVNTISGVVALLINSGEFGNVADGTSIPLGQKVSPGGQVGAAGESGTTALDSISMTTTKGDLLVDNGENIPPATASLTRLAVGTDGQVLTADSSQPTGLGYKTVLPNTATLNAIPRFSSSSGTPAPLKTSVLILSDNGVPQTISGNSRGIDAVDLQGNRAANSQVASGLKSVISGGENNTASALDSTVCGGIGNTASGVNSTASGNGNTASGQGSVAGGETNVAGPGADSTAMGKGNTASGQGSTSFGENNTANGQDSVATGNGNTASGNFSAATGYKSKADKYGQRASASGAFSTAGDCQSSHLICRTSTTDATSGHALFLDGAAALLTIPNNTVWQFDGYIVARVSTASPTNPGFCRIWQVSGAIKNNAGTVSLIGTPSVVMLFAELTMTAPAVTANTGTGSNALSITVTGLASTNIFWTCRLNLTELSC
jgi:hypothetical protein